MARFFYYHEIRQRLVMTQEEIAALAEKIKALPHHGDSFVIFGSVAWGECTWRSDIDINFVESANRSGHDEVRQLIETEYGKDNLGILISNLIQGLEHGKEPSKDGYALPELSPSTCDHFRLLAKKFGGPWKHFFDYLPCIPGLTRTREIQEYLAAVRYSYLKVKRINPNCSHFWRGNDLFPCEFSRLENFPKHLMRKILGKERKLPCPDTLSNVRRKFESLNRSWIAKLVPLFEPFYRIDLLYTELVERVKQDPSYYEQYYNRDMAALFQDLPIVEIERIVEKALEAYTEEAAEKAFERDMRR